MPDIKALREAAKNCDASAALNALPALLDELERLREQCEHPEDFCGCTMNRTGEEMTATCEWHTYPTTFAEKSATMAALAALREQRKADAIFFFEAGHQSGHDDCQRGDGERFDEVWARREP